ncbi:hypothetical protein EGW08_003893 [Elysia chlorotica]|uniref:Uncharacterized protein n=1 Tax=Elysia chlorotica TaxID=188477 RepID=A0A3S0ZXC2_ELYCH|nr:hypothetical protein EGW08_003893 [Elysia chlorotica]
MYEDAPTSTLDSAAFKALLSVAVVAVAALLALILAKLASHMYDRKIARRKERQPVDAEAADLVRARLAVMQFKRHRMGKGELTPQEASMRKTIGIWSYKGGRTLGPLKPPKKRPEPVDKTVSGMAAKHLDTKRERKVAQKADVDSQSPRTSGESPSISKEASNVNAKQSHIEISTTASSDTKATNVAGKEEVKKFPKPMDQVQLVSKVNKNVAVKPQSGLVQKLNNSGHNKVGTAPSNGAQGSLNEQSSTPKPSRELESQSSSHDTGDSANQTPRAPSSPGKGSASPRRLFTVVTPSVAREKDLKRQESTMSSKGVGKRTSDTQSMKSESGARGAAESENGGTIQAPPIKRPTTSHLSSRGQSAQKNTSSVGVAILSSNAGKQATNGKTPVSTVKVKPNTGVGVAKDDSSRADVAMAGAKG